jgi:hypothetical protein
VDTVCDHQLLPYCPDSYIVTDVGAVSDRNTPWSLNQRGEVVGSTWFYADYSGEGFISSCGQVKYIGTPQGASSSVLYSLSDYGKAAGTLALADPMPIFWNGRNVKQLDIESVGASTGGAESINAFEEIVGHLALEGVYGTEAYVWESGTVSILPNLDGQFTHAVWINDSGQIVGSAKLPAGNTAAVIWERGRIRRLPPFDDRWVHQPVHLPSSHVAPGSAQGARYARGRYAGGSRGHQPCPRNQRGWCRRRHVDERVPADRALHLAGRGDDPAGRPDARPVGGDKSR